VVGAGIQDDGDRGLARFVAILSTDRVTSYSCNVSSTGICQDNNSYITKGCKVKIVSLSCSKDEGLCRAFDLIQGE
jgi:hypothetical protein